MASTVPDGEDGREPLILVVDDDPDLLDLMREALAVGGYRIVTARNGKEALERIDEEKPRIIFLDMRMPVMNGWDFARAFHDRHGHRVPIVVVTAAEDADRRAREIGADRALGKPFDLHELYQATSEILGGVPK